MVTIVTDAPDNGITHLISLPLPETSLPSPAMPSSWLGHIHLLYTAFRMCGTLVGAGFWSVVLGVSSPVKKPVTK